MTDFHVEVVRLGALEKHPNADSLSITMVRDGFPCITRTGEFREGDLAVYVPIDAIVPADDPRWSFLGEHRRIKAKKLRGVFSMGLLTAADPSWEEGRDVAAELRIEKYEPREHAATFAGRDARDPGGTTVYDLEPLRRHKGALVPGEGVVITEKIHGCNARFMHDGETLHVGSRTRFKEDTPEDLWWAAARRYDLARRLASRPNLVLFGEAYGQVQDLKYGVPPEEGCRLAFFDAMERHTHRFLDHDDLTRLLDELGLPAVPVLYRGQWFPDLAKLAEGITTLAPANHVREGIVVRPLRERKDRCGRVVLKLAGEGYLLRKGAA